MVLFSEWCANITTRNHLISDHGIGRKSVEIVNFLLISDQTKVVGICWSEILKRSEIGRNKKVRIWSELCGQKVVGER